MDGQPMSDADPYGSNGHDVAHVDSNDGHLVLDPRQYAIEYARGYAESCAREVQRNMADESNQATYDEYLIDVRRHMESMELVTLPNTSAMDLQTEINWNMRPFMLDFLVESHAAFNLRPTTLFLAVNLMDRYCSLRIVFRDHYQLLGCAALLVAAKYGDRKDQVPTMAELRALCLHHYDLLIFQQIEWHLLETLDWVIGHPTVDNFIALGIADLPYDPEVHHLTLYLCELAMYERRLLGYRPSILARSALVLALRITGRPYRVTREWAGQSHRHVVAVLDIIAHDPTAVVSEKYAASEYSSVAVTLEAFFEQERARKRVRIQSLQHDTVMDDGVVDMVIDMDQIPQGPTFLLPGTPHKGIPMVPPGVYTPPITPEHDDRLMDVAVPLPSPPLPWTPSSGPAVTVVNPRDYVIFPGQVYHV